jgi:hypothetical protein
MVEHLVGYAKQDLMVPQQPFDDLGTANRAAAAWCSEVNNAAHSEICAVPAERLGVEQPLLAGLPSLRLELDDRPVSRKVDKLSCVRFGARYSVPCRLIGHSVTITSTTTMISWVSKLGTELAEVLQLKAAHLEPLLWALRRLWNSVVGEPPMSDRSWQPAVPRRARNQPVGHWC